MPIDSFIPKRERLALAASLNTLLASPTFASWRAGATLDVDAWMSTTSTSDRSVMTPEPGKRTPAIILSVAHLDEEERSLVLSVVLEEVLSWVRSLPGTQRLRALVVFDEVYGFLPPHPANPPTKRPIVSLMKQARAFGVGVVIATQNPMDLDYRALGNAGLWCVGRLQTDADCARVVDGLASIDPDSRDSAKALGAVVKRLAPRWFVVRDAHAGGEPVLVQPRWAMSLLRGPMTRTELTHARVARDPNTPIAHARDNQQPPFAGPTIGSSALRRGPSSPKLRFLTTRRMPDGEDLDRVVVDPIVDEVARPVHEGAPNVSQFGFASPQELSDRRRLGE